MAFFYFLDIRITLMLPGNGKVFHLWCYISDVRYNAIVSYLEDSMYCHTAKNVQGVQEIFSPTNYFLAQTVIKSYFFGKKIELKLLAPHINLITELNQSCQGLGPLLSHLRMPTTSMMASIIQDKQ